MHFRLIVQETSDNFLITIYLERYIIGGETRQTISYVTKLIQMIVCEFNLLKTNSLSHPLGTGCWAIRMDIQTSRSGLRFSLPSNNPLGIVIFITVIIHGNKIHDQDVFQFRIQSRDGDFDDRKHSPTFKEHFQTSNVIRKVNSNS